MVAKKIKTCPECGEEILGRADKKFCSDQCRNTFNNRDKQDANNYIRNVNNILRKNRRILADLNPNGKSKASRNKLIEKGFNFNYYTNVYETQQGKKYYFCYDQGYIFHEDDKVTIVEKQDYV